MIGGLLAYNCYDQLSWTAIRAVLTEIDSLPGTEVETTVGDGDGEADAAEDGLGMSWHIVGSFKGMLIVGTALWYQTVEDVFHIDTHIGVAVLVDAEAATGVLGEDIDDAGLWQGWQLAHDVASDEVESARHGSQGDFCLLNHCFNGQCSMVNVQL